MNSIEDVLTGLLFEYGGPKAGHFEKGQRVNWWTRDDSAVFLGRPGGAVDFAFQHYAKSPHFREVLAFSDSQPSYFEPDPTHPWRTEIRAELVELFDLIFEKPMTEVLYLADPTGGELERELKHLRRMDP